VLGKLAIVKNLYCKDLDTLIERQEGKLTLQVIVNNHLHPTPGNAEPSQLIQYVSNSMVVLFSRDPSKVPRAPKTAVHKNHPKNILSKEKQVHGIVLALPKPNIAIKTTKQ